MIICWKGVRREEDNNFKFEFLFDPEKNFPLAKHLFPEILKLVLICEAKM